MSSGHNENAETREMPLEELMLAESAGESLKASDYGDGDEGEFAIGPKQPVLGEYVLLRRIGAGANGRVFKARHRQMERLVALKMMAPTTMRNPEAVARFRREMKAAAKLFHPNIVTAFDAGEFEGVHYLVMEYVDGQSLSMLVHQHGPVAVEKAVEYTKQAAMGLEYAHSRNVVHRDIKPGNLVLDANGVVKILDLGTARFENESQPSDLTQTGIIMGTVNYMAPEQAQAASSVDARSDIYSLGCTLFYLLTGQTMYEGNVVQVLMAHAEQPPPSLRKLCPEAPRWLEEVFHRMVAKRPIDRPQSMGAVVQELVEGATGAAKGISRFRVHAASEARTTFPLGIDFGSASTTIACLKGGVATTLQHEGAVCVPTCVSLTGMHIGIGRAALDRVSEYEHVAWRIKRHFGHPIYSHELDGTQYPPEALAALILARLTNDAQVNLRADWSDVAMAVPSTFSDAQRKSMEDAGYIAGLEITDLINEPTAATLATVCSKEFRNQKEERHILCIDLGAGKVDAAVYFSTPGRLQTLAICGEHSLGGHDWDDLLAEAMADQIVADDGQDPRQSIASFREITRNCELAKHQITKHGETTLAFSGGHGRVLLKMTTSRFELLTGHLTRRMLKLAEQVLAEADLDWRNIDMVLLPGQATRSPAILNAIKKKIRNGAPFHQLGPEAVAQGAALYAEFQRMQRSGKRPVIEVVDVAANDLGLVGLQSGSQRRCNAVLIPKGTPLPTMTRKTFKTFRDGQDSLMIQMVQGEDQDADRCAAVGRCVINDLPPDLPLGTPFDVEFRCNAGGRVVVHVESRGIDFRATRELRRDHGLDNLQLSRWREWVETMSLCSID